MEKKLTVFARSQRLAYNDGFRVWESSVDKAHYKPEECAIIICDMWDRHWCTNATLRAGAIGRRMDLVLRDARNAGLLIVHAPSDGNKFYEEDLARKRFLALEPLTEADRVAQVEDYPQPVDSSDGGSDSEQDDFPPNTRVWKRQMDCIWIDQERDLIACDDGLRTFAHFKKRGIKQVFTMGVHTNMCVLGRSFGIKNQLRYGFKPHLVRDLTDCMYNPAKPPYVQHDEGLRLVIEYIEKFYCPSIESSDLRKAL
jgi:nicotinamidase-related amidase